MNNRSINDSNKAILYMTVLLEYINQIICNFPVMPHWEPHDMNTICILLKRWLLSKICSIMKLICTNAYTCSCLIHNPLSVITL